MLNFIVNKRSGKNRGESNLNVITEYCNAHGIEYSVYETNAPGHAVTLTRSICSLSADNVVAIGGDGTFHEVLNGITDFSAIKVGFIPSGRGNDFARAANLPLKPIEALTDILTGETKKIDYIDCGEKRCLNVAGTGMDVDVLKAVENKRNAFSYYAALIRCLLKFDPYRVVIKAKTAEGKELTLKHNCIMVGVCNGIAIGGGMKLAPDARVDDGKLDLLIAEKQNRSVFRVVGKFVKGKHDSVPEIRHYEVTEVEVENGGVPVELDGEIYEGLPLKCKVVRGGLITYKTAAERKASIKTKHGAVALSLTAKERNFL